MLSLSGYMAFSELSDPAYRHTVVEIVTSSMVIRMQMLCIPLAFCFMRYSRPETAVKCRG